MNTFDMAGYINLEFIYGLYILVIFRLQVFSGYFGYIFQWYRILGFFASKALLKLKYFYSWFMWFFTKSLCHGFSLDK